LKTLLRRKILRLNQWVSRQGLKRPGPAQAGRDGSDSEPAKSPPGRPKKTVLTSIGQEILYFAEQGLKIPDQSQ
jgi:hypothetical protein